MLVARWPHEIEEEQVILLYLKAARRLGFKTVVARLRRLALNLNHTFGCEECGCLWPHMFPFMIVDDLWEHVVGDEEAHLCLACFEKRLLDKVGRTLDTDDFSDVPINCAVLSGTKIAQHLSVGR